MSVAIIMATCNGERTLPKVLDAYRQLHCPQGNWSVIIADDGSTDGTSALLHEYAKKLPLTVLTLERGGKNAALNAALEIALRDASTELFVFTDDDATPEPDWLVQLQDITRAQPDFDVFGGAILPDWGAPVPDWLLRNVPLGVTFAITESTDGPVSPSAIWGPNMAVRRRVFDASHRFNTSVGPNRGNYVMGSETEFNRRVAAAGHRTWFCSKARVWHYIRPHQITEEFVLGRAYRAGKGGRLEAGPHSELPHLFGVPRWIYARIAKHSVQLAVAALKRNPDAKFQARYGLQYSRGYLHQARAMRSAA